MVGETLAGYRIINRLGQGGMGTVYRAYESDLKRDVALKLMKPQLLADAAAVERFKREMHQAAQVNHNCIVTILRAGVADGLPFIAMRLVPGQNLDEVMAENGPLSEARMARLIGQVGGALQAVHDSGSVHRDVKPLNILIERPGGDDEHAFLSDFGLAKALSGDGGPTGPVILGTPHYIAPEVWRGIRPGPAADQYALACTMYQGVSGGPPFERGGDGDAYRSAHLNEDPPPLANASSALAAAVMKGLAKHPEERHADIREFVSALRDAAGSSFASPGSLPSFGTARESRRVRHGERGTAFVEFAGHEEGGTAFVEFVDDNAPGIVYINAWFSPFDFPEIEPEGSALAARSFSVRGRKDEEVNRFSIKVEDPSDSQFTYSGGTGWRLRGYFALEGVVAAKQGIVERVLVPVTASRALGR